MAGKSKVGSPAHLLMSGGKRYADGGTASMCGRNGAGLPPEGRRNRQMSIDLMRAEAKPKGFATGGAPTADTSLRRGGRRSRHASGDTVNAHTGHPGYGFLDNMIDSFKTVAGNVGKGLKAGAGNMVRAHYGMDPGFSEGGHAAGGKTLRKGGRRYADGGTAQPLQGMANQVAPIAAPNERMANLAYGNTPPTGRDTSNSDNNNQTPTMKRGGRRSRHASGDTVNPHTGHPGYGFLNNMGGFFKTLGGFNSPQNQQAAIGRLDGKINGLANNVASGLANYGKKLDSLKQPGLAKGGKAKGERVHRAMGGAGKTRKHYPYT